MARPYGSPFMAGLCLAAYLGFTFACIPVQALLLLVSIPGAKRFPRWYHVKCCHLLGFRVEVRGTPSTIEPTLFVGNHVSYWDIMILSSILKASFVSKAEVASWPLFGLLAKLQRTVFIERRAGAAAKQRGDIRDRLEQGDNLILFPEGTSGDGNKALPFKSSLFGVAEMAENPEDVVFQPFSLAYSHLDGLPMGRFMRPHYAWYGDMELAPHLWEALALGRVTVIVTFYPSLTLKDAGGRKELAKRCGAVVAQGLADVLAGRDVAQAA